MFNSSFYAGLSFIALGAVFIGIYLVVRLVKNMLS